jgi:hypothetical protein
MSFATLRRATIAALKACVGCPSSFANLERSQDMRLGKHVAGIALFFAIFASSVLAIRFLTAPISPIPSVSRTAPPFHFATNVRQPLDFVEAQYVSLDFINRKSFTSLTIKSVEGQPVPGRIWVRTYFFTPSSDGGRVWAGEAIEIHLPVLNSGGTEIMAVAPCSWCNNSDAPETGYYARVAVSTVSAEATYLHGRQIDRDITTATPVVVQAEPGTNPYAAREIERPLRPTPRKFHNPSSF